MIVAMQSDMTMQVVAVLAAVGLVLGSRHMPRWWADRPAGGRRPAHRARIVVTGLAVVGGGALVVTMAVGPGPASGNGDRAGVDEDAPDAPGWLDAHGPVAASPDPVAPQTFTSGS